MEHWFVALLHSTGPHTKVVTLTSATLCVGTVLMVLLCEPIRVAHHVLDATLTLCAASPRAWRWWRYIVLVYPRCGGTAGSG